VVARLWFDKLSPNFARMELLTMECLHPSCPVGSKNSNWDDVLELPELRIGSAAKVALKALLSQCGQLGARALPLPVGNISAPLIRVLRKCPCLYTQLDLKVTAAAVVHLCEVTLGAKITSSNVYQAFQVQHPGIKTPAFLHPPAKEGASGGDIMELLCSEVLQNSGVTLVGEGKDWPEWNAKCHISLNRGKMRPLKLYGDILVPCAPHNLLISVKSEAARERFVVSGNRLESVGFGFFSQPDEFWTKGRMSMLKRWGFVAVYMPKHTLEKVLERIASSGLTADSFNINGKPLYRPLEDFGSDIERVAGKLSDAI
jgi:hypothetical protein